MSHRHLGWTWSSHTTWRIGSGFQLTKNGLEENVRWKDFGTGVRLGRLLREDQTSLVLYEADSEVTVDAFMPHSHPGGECYLVLEGEVWDEDGSYPTGSTGLDEPRNHAHSQDARQDLDSRSLA